MPIVSLISDWNSADYYIGAVKGRILSSFPETVIVDINHQIEPFNMIQAVYVIKNSYKNFPKGSIHIIAVNSETDEQRKHVIVKYDGHYFIGADNGIFYLMTEGQTELVIEIKEKQTDGFPELNIFADLACEIIKNEDIEHLGKSKKELFRQLPMLPMYEESKIVGKVIYIDSYHNVITNVSKELFEEICKNRSFKIFVQSNKSVITKINKKYNETENGELLAIFNSAGLLEIAISKAKAAQLLSLDTKSEIRIEFYNKEKNDRKDSKNDLQGRLF